MSTPPTLPSGPYVRRTARVLLVNAKNQLLLFEWPHRKDPNRSSWSTPGGGKNWFETLGRAAARERREETGLRTTSRILGARVAATAGYADLGWAKGVFRDEFFFHRVDAHEVDLSQGLDYEKQTIISTRWWTLEELDETTERVVPYGLVPLLTDLFAGRHPGRLVVLPWHHAHHRQDPAG